MVPVVSRVWDDKPAQPTWLDQYLPPRGPCGFCGDGDARHRVIDAIVERVRAGDHPDDLAEDYALPVDAVRRLVDETP